MKILFHHYGYLLLFSHLKWGSIGIECSPHFPILGYIFVYPQYILPRLSYQPSSSNLKHLTHHALFTCPNHLRLLFLSLTETSVDLSNMPCSIYLTVYKVLVLYSRLKTTMRYLYHVVIILTIADVNH